jgi:TonB family protein
MNGTAWAQVRKPLAVIPTIIEVDTTGLLIKSAPSEEKVSVADQCFATWEAPIYKKQDGQDDLSKFIMRNLEWPDKSGRLNVDGRVYVQFIIGEEGEIRDAKVTKGLHPLFDAEALRVTMLLSGHFEAAKRNGKAIPFSCTLPVAFAVK